MTPVPRMPLPERRHSWTQKSRVGGQGVFLGVGEYPDGSPGEIWLDLSKTGSTLKGLGHALAICISIGLQHGVGLSTFVSALSGLRYPPEGVVEGSAAVTEATSVIDYVMRELAAAYPPAPVVPEKVAGQYEAKSGV